MSNLTEETDDDGAPLGAAATRSGKGGNGTPKTPSAPRTRRSKNTLWIVGIALVLLAGLIPLLSSSFVSTPRDRVGISYGGGPIEGAPFQRIVEPGSRLQFNGFLDTFYLYPADQRSYMTGADDQAEGTTAVGAIRAPSKDRVLVSVQAAVYYKLNTNELQRFHEELGLRYKAYTDRGWDDMIEGTFTPLLQSAIQEESRRYEVGVLFSDAELLEAITASVQARLAERLETALGGQYFCGPDFEPGGECSSPSFVIKRLDLPENVVSAFEANRTSEIKITTRTNEIAQREAEAEAIAALGLSGDEYVLLKAVEAGTIDFWVLPSEGGVTLQAPPTGETSEGGEGGGG